MLIRGFRTIILNFKITKKKMRVRLVSSIFLHHLHLLASSEASDPPWQMPGLWLHFHRGAQPKVPRKVTSWKNCHFNRSFLGHESNYHWMRFFFRKIPETNPTRWLTRTCTKADSSTHTLGTRLGAIPNKTCNVQLTFAKKWKDSETFPLSDRHFISSLTWPPNILATFWLPARFFRAGKHSYHTNWCYVWMKYVFQDMCFSNVFFFLKTPSINSISASNPMETPNPLTFPAWQRAPPKLPFGPLRLFNSCSSRFRRLAAI